MSAAMPLQWLLKLPPTLRCYAIRPLKSRTLDNRTCQPTIVQNRQFSITRTFQAKKPKIQKAPRPAPQSPPQRAPHTPAAPRTREAPQPTLSEDGISEELRSLLVDHRQTLLYHAPQHASFFVHSYLLGTIFIVGALFTTRLLDPPNEVGEANQIRIPWYIRSATVGVALFFATVGTAFWLAPSKLIRSVHLMAPGPAGSGSPFLRFETRSSLPLMKRFRSKEAYTMYAPLGTVAMDRRVFGESVPFYDIPTSMAENATNDFSNKAHPISDSLGRFIMNFPRILWRDIRRMFVRDGFAYVRFPERSDFWKLDLHNAYILDGCKPLKAAVNLKPLNRSIVIRISKAVKAFFRNQRKAER